LHGRENGAHRETAQQKMKMPGGGEFPRPSTLFLDCFNLNKFETLDCKLAQIFLLIDGKMV